MKWRVAGASVFLTLSLLGPVSAADWPATPARLSLIEGEVVVQTPESPEWFPASSNLPLGPGDRIWVRAGGKTEIQLPEGNLVRLGSETSLDLGSPSNPNAWEPRVRFERGVASFYIRHPQSSSGVFRVELPRAFLRPSVPSSFRSDLFPDGSLQVSVYSGEVIVETPDGTTRVRGQQSFRLNPDFLPELFALAQSDDFDRWNHLRDLALSRAANPPSLPPELAAYATDFNAHGRWVSVPDYGYAWAPQIQAGWTPYREGRWIWCRGEHVWISGEPWGWVPYHYGRWRFYPVVGWVWIPPVATAVIWHPGAVAWFYGPEFVAWVALAPGEIFDGHRHYGARSVNVANVHVSKTHVTNVNVFVNATVTKAVVVVPRERFVRGERAPASFVPPRNVVTAGGRSHQGPSPIRPLRAAVHPSASRPITTPLRRPAESFSPVLARPLERRVIGVDVRPVVAQPTPTAIELNRASRRFRKEPLPQVSPPASTLQPATQSLPHYAHTAASRQVTPAHGRPAHVASSSQPPRGRPALTVQLGVR